MVLAPLCPKCGGNGHDGHTFVATEWTADDAARHGYDPERTSQDVFRCQGCGHWFPLKHWQKGAAFTLIWGVVDENGNPPPDTSRAPYFVPPPDRAGARG